LSLILYRPLGLQELRSLYQSQLRAYPRRLLGQPNLRLVKTEASARKSAEGWSTPNGALAAFVTRCAIPERYAATFAPPTDEVRSEDELMVPTERLIEFNGKLDSPICVVAAYYGGRFTSYAPVEQSMPTASSEEQFLALAATLERSSVEALRAMATHPLATFINFYFWESHDFADRGIDAPTRDGILSRLRQLWADTEHARMPLGISSSTEKPPPTRR